MEQQELLIRIVELEKQIAELPAGSIAKKRVRGKDYYYHRWFEGKKRVEKYLPLEAIDELRKKIEQRKVLESELKMLRSQMPKQKTTMPAEQNFVTNVRTGPSLRAYSASVRKYKKRECYQRLYDFVYGESIDKVLILYGLRHTGKTTMIRQILAEMTDVDLAKTAFIQITAKDSLADVNHDLKCLESQDYRNVFLDEVTLMEDFIQGAALFSDIFAACGMKIVLSGADSLSFLLAEDEQLYDRCILLHTTFIPYREFENVLGITGIDEYIRYGGTMNLGGVHYNETSIFAGKKSTDEYVDSAVARNIQHSLRCYQYGGHFHNLQELYEQGELTSAINRVVEDINHRFTIEVLTRDSRFNDLVISARNLRRDRGNPTDILDRIDLVSVTENLHRLLEIRNHSEQSIVINRVHSVEIQEYLHLLDLIQEIDIVSFPNVNQQTTRTVITQPGLRFAQANALVQSLLLDEIFVQFSLLERNAVLDRILSEIAGRMMEDIVLLETKLANHKKEVFILQFPVGEFDMVLFDPAIASCSIFEIKYSTEIVPSQYRHLIDKKKCVDTEHRYGPITAKTVLYRGSSQMVDGIRYMNVEEYLRQL